MGLGFQRGLVISPCVPRYGDCEGEISALEDLSRSGVSTPPGSEGSWAEHCQKPLLCLLILDRSRFEINAALLHLQAIAQPRTCQEPRGIAIPEEGGGPAEISEAGTLCKHWQELAKLHLPKQMLDLGIFHLR